uniref:Uncharacterized protein n=1 Tax=Rhizophora mucronata TaxID=61149 RepID=A0A2P2NSQ2_RHIMU
MRKSFCNLAIAEQVEMQVIAVREPITQSQGLNQTH